MSTNNIWFINRIIILTRMEEDNIDIIKRNQRDKHRIYVESIYRDIETGKIGPESKKPSENFIKGVKNIHRFKEFMAQEIEKYIEKVTKADLEKGGGDTGEAGLQESGFYQSSSIEVYLVCSSPHFLEKHEQDYIS